MAIHTTCRRGHPLIGENLKRNRDGSRQCRACFNHAIRNRRARLRAERLGLAAPVPAPAPASVTARRGRCACGRTMTAGVLPRHQTRCLAAVCAELGVPIPDFRDIIRNLSSIAASRGSYQ